jgi:cytochrome bd-type quinol oxidase subunit 1
MNINTFLFFTVYFSIGLIIAIVSSIIIGDKDDDFDDYMSMLVMILAVTIGWGLVLPLLPVWIANKLRKDK